jgi:hypothetical protein
LGGTARTDGVAVIVSGQLSDLRVEKIFTSCVAHGNAAITAEGRLFVFGQNNRYELDPSGTDIHEPVELVVKDSEPVSEVVFGEHFTFLLCGAKRGLYYDRLAKMVDNSALHDCIIKI